MVDRVSKRVHKLVGRCSFSGEPRATSEALSRRRVIRQLSTLAKEPGIRGRGPILESLFPSPTRPAVPTCSVSGELVRNNYLFFCGVTGRERVPSSGEGLVALWAPLTVTFVDVDPQKCAIDTLWFLNERTSPTSDWSAWLICMHVPC